MRTDGDFPRSEQDARNHIRSIRLDRGVDDVMGGLKENATTEDLQELLNVVATDLYQSPTHFILELIQNTDDNSYKPGVNPTVIMTKGPGTFRMDCNERGFTKANVESICRSGKSSKKGASKSAGYIGEKGIGFKSVFKVAKEVWIKSGHYSFKFDRSTPLGMVIPCWEPFPVPPRDGFTSFYFNLATDYNEAELTRALAMLDSGLLMFLRKLKRIEINVDAALSPLSTKVLTRQDRSKTIRELSMGDQVTRCFLFRHVVNNLPKEERRPDMNSSEIVLGFPFSSASGEIQPFVAEQSVYAFLPVRGYGLQFMMHADFVLVANREDINSASWNSALLNGAVNVFPRAIDALVKANPSLRYSWVRYLPTGGFSSSHLHGFPTNLLRELRSAAILESHSGKAKAPSSLIFVPKQYRDPEGVPITLTKELGDRYLGPRYDDSDWKYLEVLGVKEISKGQFLAHLKTCLKERTADRHAQWHSEVAAILLRVATSEDMADLPIIPLRNGTWVTPKEPAYFLAGRPGNEKQEVPKGIEIPVVDRQASDDKERRLLMMALGVKEFKEEDVARLIIEAHRSNEFRPDKLSVKDLVAHAEFLYRTRLPSSQEMDVDLWIATDDGRRLRASSAYIRMDPPIRGASKYLKASKTSSFGFAHRDYLDTFDKGDDDGRGWLQRALGLEAWPRFLNPKYVTWDKAPSTTEARKVIHPDFLEIMDRKGSVDFLGLIAEGWEAHYRFHFELLSRGKQSQDQTALEVAANYLRRFNVPCCNGQSSAPLEETTLPLPHLQRIVPWCRSFLHVPHPEHPGWACLAHLGVKVVGDLSFYLQCLRYAKAGDAPCPRIPPIMQQIQARAEEDIPLLVDTMSNESLICRPAADGTPVWVPLSTCVWDGEKWFRAVTGLRHLYPDCETLFTRHLRCERLDIRHLLMELHAIPPSCDVNYISVVLTLFQSLHSDGRHAVSRNDIHECQSIAMFPITTKAQDTKSNAGTNGDGYERLASLEDPDWFVADKAQVKSAFAGQLPMLAFDVAKASELTPLFKLLGMRSRLLSDVSTRVAKTEGSIVEGVNLAMFYRSRGAFIQRLIPREAPSRARFVRQLQNIVVRFCNGITVSWSVENSSGSLVQSRGIGVPVVLEEKEGGSQLEILAVHGYGIDELPLELSEALAEHLGIATHYSSLLFLVLMTSVGQDRLTAAFRDAAVPEYDDNWEFTIEGGYEGLTDKRHAENGRLELKVDLDKIRLTPFEPDMVAGKLLSVSGGVMGIALLFANGDGSKADLSKPRANWGLRISASKYSAGSLALPLLLLKGKMTKKISSREQYHGEKTMSAILQAILGNAYQPDSHWTSYYRAKAGYADYSANNTSRASFTVPDSTGRLAHYLAHKGYKKAAQWTKCRVVYHIEVKSTEDKPESVFQIANEELDRAMSFSHSRVTARVPEHVCIWVRMGNIRNPGGAAVQFLVDPWNMWILKQLTIDSVGGFLGKC